MPPNSSRSAQRTPLESLSRRERLSAKTVETYRSRMMQKLGVDGVPALVKFAVANGITPAA